MTFDPEGKQTATRIGEEIGAEFDCFGNRTVLEIVRDWNWLTGSNLPDNRDRYDVAAA